MLKPDISEVGVAQGAHTISVEDQSRLVALRRAGVRYPTAAAETPEEAEREKLELVLSAAKQNNGCILTQEMVQSDMDREARRREEILAMNAPPPLYPVLVMQPQEPTVFIPPPEVPHEELKQRKRTIPRPFLSDQAELQSSAPPQEIEHFSIPYRFELKNCLIMVEGLSNDEWYQQQLKNAKEQKVREAVVFHDQWAQKSRAWRMDYLAHMNFRWGCDNAKGLESWTNLDEKAKADVISEWRKSLSSV
jgi:hypothetical protein